MTKVYLHKVRINQGGYDDKGRYFGVSDCQLWFWQFDGAEYCYSDYLRGSSRESAKGNFLRMVGTRYPELTFTFYR